MLRSSPRVSRFASTASLLLLLASLLLPQTAFAQATGCLCTVTGTSFPVSGMSGASLVSYVTDIQMREAQATCEGLAPGSRFNPSNLNCAIPTACTPAFTSTLNDHLTGQPVTASCTASAVSATTPAPATTPATGTTPATTPPPATEAAAAPSATDESVAGAGTTVTPRAFVPIVPNPSVPIPGVTFTPAVEDGNFISIPYLAQYISGIYRLSVGLGAILAAIMIVFGGFKYMLAASLPEVKDGKTIITDAVIGLVVLLSSYLILKTINPKLVEVSPLRVQRILEEAPVRQSGEFTGNPAATGFDTTSHSETSSCGGGASGQTRTYEGVPFTVLPLRKSYEQIQAPWAPLSYGSNLTNNESMNPCYGSGHGGNGFTQPVTGGCTQTFLNGGCGPTAFATIMAFYGVQTTNPGDAALASHVRLRDGEQLVDLAAHPRGQTISGLLQARIGSHLFDPIDAGRLIVSQGHGGSGGRASTSQVPSMEGFTNRAVENSAAAAAQIRAGHPLIFYCNHCMLKLRNMSDTDHQGGHHYMVIHGVSTDGRWFLVQDSGGGGSAGGKFLSAAEIDTGHPSDHPSEKSVKLTAVTPTSATTQPCTTSNDGPAATNNASASRPVASTSGETSHFTYTFRPDGATSDRGWSDVSAAILPTRLLRAFNTTGSARPRVRVYIYLHGQNGTGATTEQALRSGTLHSIKSILGQSAGSKNIIVLAPRYITNIGTRYFNAFDITQFYNRSITALQESISGFQGSDVQDVVVSGHSSATCAGPGSPLLHQALTGNFGSARLRGIVAYDGCLGDTVSSSAFSLPANVSLYLNPDVGENGMGIHTNGDGSGGNPERYKRTRTNWDLRRIACPGAVTNLCPMDTTPVEPSAPGYNQRRCNACYGRTESGREIISYETAYGHNESVPKMTELMFQAFYANQN